MSWDYLGAWMEREQGTCPLVLHIAAGNPNSCPHPFTVRALVSELSLQPKVDAFVLGSSSAMSMLTQCYSLQWRCDWIAFVIIYMCIGSTFAVLVYVPFSIFLLNRHIKFVSSFCFPSVFSGCHLLHDVDQLWLKAINVSLCHFLVCLIID